MLVPPLCPGRDGLQAHGPLHIRRPESPPISRRGLQTICEPSTKSASFPTHSSNLEMHIYNLPTKTLLQILSDLPIQSICAFEGVSRTFNKFVGKNVDAIYKVAAVMHQFAPQSVARHEPQAALKETLKASGPTKWLNDVHDWRQFCEWDFGLGE